MPTDDRTILLCGDFNCIDTAHDAVPTPRPTSGRWVGAPTLQSFLSRTLPRKHPLSRCGAMHQARE